MKNFINLAILQELILFHTFFSATTGQSKCKMHCIHTKFKIAGLLKCLEGLSWDYVVQSPALSKTIASIKSGQL